MQQPLKIAKESRWRLTFIVLYLYVRVVTPTSSRLSQ